MAGRGEWVSFGGRRCARSALFTVAFGLSSGSLCAAPGPANAVAEAAPFELDYASDFSCPDADAFTELVRAKLGPSESSAATATPARVRVRLRAVESGFAGQLAVTRPDTSDYSRDVTSSNCSEVANALAFVLALTLSAKEVAPDGTAAPPPAAAPPPPPPAPPVAEPPPVPAPPIAPVVSAQPAPSDPSQNRVLPARTWDFGAGGQIGARTGLGPVWTTIGSAFLEARRLRSNPFTLALRASFLDGQVVTREDRNGTTHFTWLAGRIEVCPALLRLFAGLSVSPCVGSHVGRIKAVGTPRVSGGQGSVASKLWLDGVATLRVALQLAPWLSLEAQGDLLFPLTRYDFGFDDPQVSVYSVPGVARAGSVGLAVHFP